LPWREDAVGNLVVCRPGSGGGEDASPVLLQGHVDMVCEKNAETVHDFEADPIRLQVEHGWLRASGTTLGADNGVGVAAALAVLEQGSDAVLPPIEALFTVDEETGLTGAFGLDGSLVSATRLLNLDTEEFGSIYIGCAGGGDSKLSLEAPRNPAPAECSVLLRLKVQGLMGGHSGIDIHEGRGNAVLMAVALAADALAASPHAVLVELAGGDKHNAIPREASVVIGVPPEDEVAIEAAVAKRLQALREEFGLLEKGLSASVETASEVKAKAFSRKDASRFLAALRLLPHGVIKMSHAMEGLVETSNNVASITTTDEGLKVLLSTRSSLGSALEAARERLQAVADLTGGSLVMEPAYPGWAPAPASPLLEVTRKKLKAICNEEPKILAIHAGLECGILLEKCPTLREAVSFGPTITGAHSPDEALEIDTVSPFFRTVLAILAELAAERQ